MAGRTQALKSKFVVSPEAEEDVFHISRYLFREANVVTANRIEAELLDAFANLAKTPNQGHRRSDLTSARVLFYTVYQYMVVYRLGPPVQIVGVLHGRRDVRKILGKRL